MTSPQPLSNFWRLVSQKCNNFLLAGSSRPTCLKFVIDGFFVGLIRPDMLSSLLRYPNIFVWISHPTSGERCISLHPSLDTIEKRTSAVSHAMLDLRQSNTVKALKGWRDEDYGVYVGERKQLLMSIERSASSLLGIVRYGVHINGYFIQPSTQKLLNSHRSSNGGCNLTSCTGDASELLSKYDPSRVMMWLGVRSLNKPTWPGMIDNMAAGGLSVGMDVIECAIKECQEEASIPIEFFDSLKPVGRLSYIFEDERGNSLQISFLLVPMGKWRVSS
ncbi:unnamed protein product [Calicophoron daubneyi]|uniref:DUF4743 domain-containing protein n=1 Tax=Calicophoron daubneyi TaxID=300641 RepID=A0AAV2T2C4_CALDB